MTAEQVLIQKFQVLPEEKQARVLEFVEELQKTSEATDKLPEIKAENEARRERVMSLVGMAKGRRDLSISVDEILAEGSNKREGWSLP